MASKGDEIRFIAGKYAGKNGWINIARYGDEVNSPVIVDLGPRGDRATVVKRSSFRQLPNGPPTSYVDAVMAQCPDVETSVVATCRKLAKCNMHRDPQGFQNMMNIKMQEAIQWQNARKVKYYRHVQYDDPNQMEG